MMNILSHESLKELVEMQLAVWDLAERNYHALSTVRRRRVEVGDMTCGIQFNPARIHSTGANLDRKAIASRPCFLCDVNRPSEQIAVPIMSGWDLLVNPYPIFPLHFTIVSKNHVPQKCVPDEIVSAALSLPGMTVFFNGARAGASAPDHLHMQAVLKEEIPLISLAEKIHHDSENGIRLSSDFGLKLPFAFFSGVIDPSEGTRTLSTALRLGGLSEDGTLNNPELVNVFFWLSDGGKLRFISIPRRAHRPRCYFESGDSRRLVSPGCIDMGGVVITPREEDFKNITSEDIIGIYKDVGLTDEMLIRS